MRKGGQGPHFCRLLLLLYLLLELLVGLALPVYSLAWASSFSPGTTSTTSQYMLQTSNRTLHTVLMMMSGTLSAIKCRLVCWLSHHQAFHHLIDTLQDTIKNTFRAASSVLPALHSHYLTQCPPLHVALLFVLQQPLAMAREFDLIHTWNSYLTNSCIVRVRGLEVAAAATPLALSEMVCIAVPRHPVHHPAALQSLEASAT
jgi:hypothetical protein